MVQTRKDTCWDYLWCKGLGDEHWDPPRRKHPRAIASRHLAPSSSTLGVPLWPHRTPAATLLPAPEQWDVVPLQFTRHPPGQGCVPPYSWGNFTKVPRVVGMGCGFTPA